jgi:hypothetical protein
MQTCEQAIRTRAYQLWEEAGSPPGDGVDFWLQAEAEFLEQFDEALDETLDDAVNLCSPQRVAAK